MSFSRIIAVYKYMEVAFVKYVFYCPKCKAFWQSDSSLEGAVENCLSCGARPVFTDYSTDDWKALDKPTQEEVCRTIERRILTDPQVQYSKSNLTIWMRIIRSLNWLFFSLIVIAAIVVAVLLFKERPFLGFIIVLGTIIVGLILIASNMLFVDMARDIRAIRNAQSERH